MILNTGEKLASIHSKIRTIHKRLDNAASSCEDNITTTLTTENHNFEASVLATTTISRQCCGLERLLQRLQSKLPLLRFAIQKQVKYYFVQYFKIIIKILYFIAKKSVFFFNYFLFF